MIEDEDVEQPEDIEKNQYYKEIEAGDLESKECEKQTQGQEGPTQENGLSASK